MMADLVRRKLLFKVKTQLANSSSGQGGDERHSAEVNRQMHSEEIKIVDIVEEHLQTKEKPQNIREMIGAESKKRVMRGEI
jgi:hypothetical protein